MVGIDARASQVAQSRPPLALDGMGPQTRNSRSLGRRRRLAYELSRETGGVRLGRPSPMVKTLRNADDGGTCAPALFASALDDDPVIASRLGQLACVVMLVVKPSTPLP